MCVVHYFLGIPCPGCGLLRSFWALLHLDFAGSFHFFPLWPAVVLFFVFRRQRYAGEVFVGLLLFQWVVRVGVPLFPLFH